jgi:hypothetical protein
MNYIFTWASGEKFLALPEVNVYFKSLKKYHPQCVSIVFTHDMPAEFVAKLEDAGHLIEAVDAPKFLIRDRHLEYSRFIQTNLDPLDNVIFSDCKDVVFQRNIFQYVEEMDMVRQFILLCDEGMQQYQSEWNAMEQFKLRSQANGFEINFTNLPVLNGGFIYGTAELLADFALTVWSTTLFTQNVTDQGVINFLYYFKRHDRRYRVMSPQNMDYVVTGETIKQDLFKPLFENGLIIHPTSNKPYCAFHQWDRTVYKDEILSGYLND